MANAMKIINYIITFIVGFIALILIRLLVLPPLLIFIPGLRTPFLTKFWEFMMNFGFMILGILLIVLLILWIIYNILIRIFPINLIIKPMPPFPQLKRAGIFGLFDAIAGIVVSSDGAKNRLLRLGNAIGNFIWGSIDMMTSTIGELVGADKLRDKINSASAKAPPLPVTPEPEDTNESPFSAAQTNAANEKYSRCLEQETIIITDSMSAFERQSAQASNALAPTKCKLQGFTEQANSFAS